MQFEDLMEDDVLGTPEKQINPFNNETKDERYFDAMTGNSKKPIKQKSEQEIIDSILQANTRVNTKTVTPPNNSNNIQRETYSNQNTSSNVSETREEKIKKWQSEQEQKNTNFFNATENNKKIEKNTLTLTTDNTILAVVYLDQIVNDKGRVHLRLSKDAIIDGVKYVRNTFFYGFTHFEQNRIYIDINSINNRKVSLCAYDAQDFGLGIYTNIPFANIAKEDAKDDVIDDLPTANVPFGNTIKNIVKGSSKVDKVTLFNETKITLKSKI